MDELKLDETTFNMLKVIEDKHIASTSLYDKLEGYYTCTRFLLEELSSNLVENQISGVADNCDSYEHRIDTLVRRIDLLEHYSNQYFDKWFVVLDANSCYQILIIRHVMNVLFIFLIS